MFNLERQFSPNGATGVVVSESRKLSAAEHRKDVYDSHRHRVFSVAYYMTANEIEAEQIMTETFVRVFTGNAQVTGHHVDQVLLDELAQRFELQTTETAVPDPALLLERAANRRTALEEALPTLPPLERLVFLLRDVEGYSAAKIAPLVQLNEAEVQRTALSARIRLRNELAVARLREEHAARGFQRMEQPERDEQQLEAEEPEPAV